MESWSFIIIQTVLVVIWMILHVVSFLYHWDMYPFILFNLLFSTQADYNTTVEGKIKIDVLTEILHKIKVDKLDKIIALL